MNRKKRNERETPPAQEKPAKEDEPLESLGKAITDPVKAAVGDEDLDQTAGGQRPAPPKGRPKQ